MKRTPLERKTPLRRTRIQRARTTEPTRRKPRPGREFWQTQREVIYSRAAGRCEHCGRDLDDAGMEAHHRKLRSQGGGHGVENLAALCPGCHKWAHANPDDATRLGFIVRSRSVPAQVAVTLHTGRIVRFTPEGGYDTCFTEHGEACA